MGIYDFGSSRSEISFVIIIIEFTINNFEYAIIEDSSTFKALHFLSAFKETEGYWAFITPLAPKWVFISFFVIVAKYQI